MQHNGRTVGESIVEYLRALAVDELTARDTWPWDATQMGIAAAVGVSRAHVALEVRRLEAKGLVERLQAHVRDARTRLFVYRVSPQAGDRIHTLAGGDLPITRGELRELRVVVIRCPNCGRTAHVALDG